MTLPLQCWDKRHIFCKKNGFLETRSVSTPIRVRAYVPPAQEGKHGTPKSPCEDGEAHRNGGLYMFLGVRNIFCLIIYLLFITAF